MIQMPSRLKLWEAIQSSSMVNKTSLLGTDKVRRNNTAVTISSNELCDQSSAMPGCFENEEAANQGGLLGSCFKVSIMEVDKPHEII